jgi:hypothetical protein
MHINGIRCSREAPLSGRCPRCAVSGLDAASEATVSRSCPDPATDKIVRWRCVDLRKPVAQRFSVTVHVHTISKWLNQLGLTRLQPRPVHPKKDPEAEVTFKKNFTSLAKAALLSTTTATPVPLEIWFQDELVNKELTPTSGHRSARGR